MMDALSPDKQHQLALAMLALKLMRAEFKESLRNAVTPAEVVQIVRSEVEQ